MSEMEKIYKQSSTIVSREIAGEMILVPIRQNVGDLESIFTLNETAALAWNLMDGHHSLANIQILLVDQYPVDSQLAGQDLLDLVAELLQLDAIEQV